MQVPTVRFMDLYVYPTSTLEIRHKDHKVHIRALDTSIEGSHHIESLNCNERFILNLSVNLGAEDDMCVLLKAAAPPVATTALLNIEPLGSTSVGERNKEVSIISGLFTPENSPSGSICSAATVCMNCIRMLFMLGVFDVSSKGGPVELKK